MQTRHQLAKGKWLGQIVVRAGIESLYAVIDRVARREHQDRSANAALSDRSAQVESAPAGKHHIEDDDVESAEDRPRLTAGQRCFADDVHRVLGEPALDHVGQFFIVFDN